MSAIGEVAENVGRFYTHFLGRDLAYLVAGGVPLYVALSLFDGGSNWSRDLPTLEGVGIVLVSYFIGVLISANPLLVDRRNLKPENYASDLKFIDEARTKLSPEILRVYERNVIFMHVGAALTSGSFLTGGVVLMYVIAKSPSINAIEPVQWVYLVTPFVVFALALWSAQWTKCYVKKLGRDLEAMMKELPK